MEDEKILIDRETLKAISSDTRMDILKYLSKRKYTLSEISKKINLKNPTVKEHLDHLISAGLVVKEDSSNIWKYYSLSEKGRKLIKPKEIKVLISFVISLFATFGLIGLYLINFVLGKTSLKSTGNSMTAAQDIMVSRSIENAEPLMQVSMDSSQAIVDTTITSLNTTNNKEIILIMAILTFLALTIFLLFILVKDKLKRKKECIKIIE